MSPRTNLTRSSMFARFSRRPVLRLSMTVTSFSSHSARAMFDPMNPAPPVTTILLSLIIPQDRDPPYISLLASYSASSLASSRNSAISSDRLLEMPERIRPPSASSCTGDRSVDPLQQPVPDQ